MLGLTSEEAKKRLREYGPNALPERPAEPFSRKLLRQFQSPLIYILLLALLVDLLLWLYEGARGVPLESLVILAILLLNALLGAFQEKRSEEALKRLKALAEPSVWVLRDGRFQRLSARGLVPGDVVRLEAGDRVPADGVLLEGSGLLVDESVLTGESVPVEKGVGEEVFAGTLLVRGRALLEVTRTGAQSAMGRIAHLLAEMEEEKTPLERRLHAFGHRVARLVLLLALGLLLLGFLVEGVSAKVVLFAVALAVAAVPEGLPAVLTLALALGVERMARRKAVVRRLSAVEALGSVTVIATDKTGTLTENRMEVQELLSPDPEKALLAMVLCNDADLATGAGDPLELGLLRYASRFLDVERVRREHPRLSERPFDSAWKFMRVTTPLGSFLKGAPEALIPRLALPQEEQARLFEEAGAHAAKGFRVLALAFGEGEREEGLRFLGFVLLLDPPRPEVPEAVARVLKAGVRVVMVTGDHPATALAIARRVGMPAEVVATGEELEALSDEELLKVDVFARVRPEQKLRIVEALQKAGEVVAMTGDGVNDAPALKAAHIGIAMGGRGTDVAREASSLVLLDDDFASIVKSIRMGRRIFDHLQKAFTYIVAVHVPIAGMSLIPIFLQDAPLVLSPVHILFLELVIDPACSIVFEAEPESPDLMSRPPRDPCAPLFGPGTLALGIMQGLTVLAGVLLVYFLALKGWLPPADATALSFTTLVLANLGLIFVNRSWSRSLVATLRVPNPALWAVCGATLFFLVLVLYTPGLRSLFHFSTLHFHDLLLCVLVAVASLLWFEGLKWVWRWGRGN